MDLSFLDNIKLESENRVKSVRFSDSEMYLVKYIKFKERNFSEYVKELILQDIEKYIALNGVVSREEVIEIVKQVINSM